MTDGQPTGMERKRLLILTRNRAFRALAARHPREYQRLLLEERKKVGLRMTG